MERIVYEWGLEWLDELEDIVCVDFQGRVKDFYPDYRIDGVALRLCLIRRDLDPDSGAPDEWAYAIPGSDGCWTLPDVFQTGRRVPQRFKQELARAKLRVTK